MLPAYKLHHRPLACAGGPCPGAPAPRLGVCTHCRLGPDPPTPRLQVAKDIWVCEGKAVTPWKGTIREYKNHLAKKMGVNH